MNISRAGVGRHRLVFCAVNKMEKYDLVLRFIEFP